MSTATGQGACAERGEFAEIARLFRPLTFGAPEALDLMDDAAVLPGRPGFDLVVTQDALVEGVHFLPSDPPESIGRKLLRVNLSDLAAKAAEPYGAFLTIAWPPHWAGEMRDTFARGLGEDLRAFGVSLMGGDTVSTPGPLMASLTLMGWVPAGAMLRRGGARPGDLLLVSGTVGDGTLGLDAAQGGLRRLDAEARAQLKARYRRPEPRLPLRSALRAHAAAAADVSDGLLADAGHIGQASGCGVDIDLEALPLSEAAAKWLSNEPDEAEGRLRLATGGDDYEIVCAAEPHEAARLIAAAGRLGVRMTVVGRTGAEPGTRAAFMGHPLEVAKTGWSHS